MTVTYTLYGSIVTTCTSMVMCSNRLNKESRFFRIMFSTAGLVASVASVILSYITLEAGMSCDTSYSFVATTLFGMAISTTLFSTLFHCLVRD